MAAPPNQPEAVILLGRIVAPFGVHGWIKIQPYTAEPEGLLVYESFLVGREQPGKRFEVETASVHGQTVLCKLKGLEDRDQAVALKGWELAVYRHEMPESGEDEIYWADLIGMLVVNTEGVTLGMIAEMIDNGAQSVARVVEESPARRERLIPFVSAFVQEVSPADRRVIVEWGADF